MKKPPTYSYLVSLRPSVSFSFSGAMAQVSDREFDPENPARMGVGSHAGAVSARGKDGSMSPSPRWPSCIIPMLTARTPHARRAASIQIPGPLGASHTRPDTKIPQLSNAER